MNKILISDIFILLLMLLYSCSTSSQIPFDGIYAGESTNEYATINKDTMRLYKSIDDTAVLLAECSIKRIKGNWYRINSMDGFRQGPFTDMTVNASEYFYSGNKLKITISTPNCMRPLSFSVESQSPYSFKTVYSQAVTKNGEAIIYTPFCNKFRIAFGFSDITPSDPSGRFYGLLWYSKEIELESNKMRTVELVFPNVTEEVLNRYYIADEFIYATDSCIYRKGVKYLRKK